jgi:hypothetical protein
MGCNEIWYLRFTLRNDGKFWFCFISVHVFLLSMKLEECWLIVHAVACSVKWRGLAELCNFDFQHIFVSRLLIKYGNKLCSNICSAVGFISVSIDLCLCK